MSPPRLIAHIRVTPAHRLSVGTEPSFPWDRLKLWAIKTRDDAPKETPWRTRK